MGRDRRVGEASESKRPGEAPETPPAAGRNAYLVPISPNVPVDHVDIHEDENETPDVSDDGGADSPGDLDRK